MRLLLLLIIPTFVLIGEPKERFIHFMTLQGDYWFRGTILDSGEQRTLSWRIYDFKRSKDQKEITYSRRISKKDVDILMDIVGNSEQFQENNQRKPDGEIGLGEGFIIALHEGPIESGEVVVVYDLPPDLQSKDLKQFLALTDWAQIKDQTNRGREQREAAPTKRSPWALSLLSTFAKNELPCASWYSPH